MQGADKVNDELEVGFDEAFERRWSLAERVGRVVMVLVTAAGLAGLLGRGPYSHRTEKIAESDLAVDFEPIARSQTGTQVTIHLNNPTSAPTVNLFISSNAVEPMGLQRILPQPVITKTVKDGLMLTIAVPPGSIDVDLRLMLMPVGIGSNELSAHLEGHSTLRWTQLVVP